MTETIVDKTEQSDRYAQTPGKEWVQFLAVNISLCKKNPKSCLHNKGLFTCPTHG